MNEFEHYLANIETPNQNKTDLQKRNTELLNKWNLDQSSEKISQKHFQDLKKENEGLQKQVSDLEQQLDDLLKSK